MASLDLLSWLWQNLLLVGVASILYFFLGNWLKPGVRSIPGPWLAKVSDLWRYYDVAKGRPDITLYQLHQRHGDYVRLGPTAVSVKNIEVLKTIYGINSGYAKSSFYWVQQQLANGKPTVTLFSSLDEDFHASIKKPISSAYSMTTLTEFEPFVDRTIRALVSQLDERFARPGSPCDIATWLQYYAFDTIGELTFSKSLGFLEQGRDIDGIMKALEKTFDYAGKTGQMPWTDYLFVKNPVRAWLFGAKTAPIAQFARDRLGERLYQNEKKAESAKQPRDFLTRFLEAKTTHPDIVDDKQVFSYTVTNMFAGSDTTAISLRAVLYFTLKNPSILARLDDELSAASAAGNLNFPVTWKQSQSLPYLDAVVKEALRLHPAVGLPLERLVPSSGLQLPNGPFLPAGTIVGVSPWIIHRDETIFGAHANDFNPDRWLQKEGETETEFKTRERGMVRATFTFGAGSRTCIGKNVSLLEIYKVIPSLFWRYEIRLKDQEKEWELTNAWFVRQKGMDIYLTQRDGRV
ncbi:cytochrome P450 [Stipitochalara longipes BDJ]|nr:cytochrome P450 [Stipitochalara longipes BDJ]